MPLAAIGLSWLHIFRNAGMWLIYIWPSSIMLMATENMNQSVEASGILAYSIAINVVPYVVVFSILWSLAWVVRA